MSGPIIPGIPEHTIFLSAERGFFGDADPPAIPLEFYSTENGTMLDEPVVFNSLPNNNSEVLRLQGKIKSRFGAWNVQLSGLGNTRTYKNSKTNTAGRQW